MLNLVEGKDWRGGAGKSVEETCEPMKQPTRLCRHSSRLHFRRKLHETLDDLPIDLAWAMEFCNQERPNQVYRTEGHTSYRAFLEGTEQDSQTGEAQGRFYVLQTSHLGRVHFDQQLMAAKEALDYTNLIVLPRTGGIS